MCKSKLEGGWRCYSHTSKEHQKIVEAIAETRKELDRNYSKLSQVKFYITALDRQWEDGQINDETYNRELDRLVGYRDRGESVIAENQAKLSSLETQADKVQAEIHTTFTGLKNLQSRIDAEADPDEKRKLQITYNVSRRISIKRAEAYQTYKKNKVVADALKVQAKEMADQARAIVVSSPDHARLRDETMLEAKKISADAYLIEHNGNMEAQALFDARTGEIVPAKLVDGKYGKTWAILSDANDPTSKPSKFVSPPRGKTYTSRAEFWKEKGLRLGTVWVPGKAHTVADEFDNKTVIVKRNDGGFSPYAILGQEDVYSEKVKEEQQAREEKKKAKAAA